MLTSIEHLASQYPHLTAAFANIPQGVAHLRRIQDLNATWQNMLLSGTTRQYTEVVVTEDRTPVPAVDTFDIIYAGGGLNLLHAAVMTQRYGLRVLVFDRFTVGAVHRARLAAALGEGLGGRGPSASEEAQEPDQRLISWTSSAKTRPAASGC